jgi:uncharacterized membrane protein YcaP (DUF421 family)
MSSMTLLHHIIQFLFAIVLVAWPLVLLLVMIVLVERSDGQSRVVIKDGKVRLRRCVRS